MKAEIGNRKAEVPGRWVSPEEIRAEIAGLRAELHAAAAAELFALGELRVAAARRRLLHQRLLLAEEAALQAETAGLE